MGEFNGWSDAANPMTNDGGAWTLALDLAPGSYQYKFVVDGNWKQDDKNPEAAPDGFGGNNSIMKVGAGGAVAAPAAAAPAVKVAPAAPAAAGGKCAVTFAHAAPGASLSMAQLLREEDPHGRGGSCPSPASMLR